MTYSPHPDAGLLTVIKEAYWLAHHECESVPDTLIELADDPEAGVLFTPTDVREFIDLYHWLDLDGLAWDHVLERMVREVA